MITLYIKTHNKTGLKYFGKTIKENIHKYKGSGKYWTRHIKKHGYDVTTEIYYQSNDIIEIKDIALQYSYMWDIVKNKDYANLTPENGLDGGFVSVWNKGKTGLQKAWNKGMFGKFNHSKETKQKISISSKNRKVSKETGDKIKESWKDRPILKCPYCSKTGRGGAMIQWHFDNCKFKNF